MGTRSTKILSALLLAYLLVPFSAGATEWVEGYTNARAVGMGGALIGVTSDETSLYRNPANLGSVRGYFGSLIDPELEGQSSFTDLVSVDSFTKAVEVEKMAEILKMNPGEFYHAKVQFSPSFTTKNFGFGFLYRNELNGLVSQTATTSMNTFYQNDLAAVLGANQSLFGGVVKIGASVKLINRIEIVSGTLSTNGPFDLGSIATEGTGLAYDAGVVVQLPLKWVPTISAVAHDLGDTKFNLRDGMRATTTSQPTTVKQSLDAAVSLFPILGNQIRSLWTVEYRDITNSREETGSAKRLHIGTEVNFKDLFFLRAGLNQSYFTGGIEISSERFAWQISSYGEEIGTAENPKEDRRYSTRILIRF